MARRNELFSLAPAMKSAGIVLILVQIEEAHTNEWPIGKDYQPNNHVSMQDRTEHATTFVSMYNPPFPVFVDNFDDNLYEETFHSWPDKYYYFNNMFNVLEHSTYHQDSSRDGMVKLDVVDMIKGIINVRN